MSKKIGLFLVSTLLMSSAALASEIIVSGSTSEARLMDVLAERYNAHHAEPYIAVQGIGSTAGITLVQKDIANVGMSSRYLTEKEDNPDLSVNVIAYDGLAIVVNNANPVNSISREQLYDVYKGKITNWKQLGGIDQKIAVVTRESSSGSRYSFETLLGLTKIVNNRLVSDINRDNLVVNSNSMVKTLVNHNKQAIGFISMGSVDSSIKAIQFDGSYATEKTILQGKYGLSRPFLILYKEQKIDEQTKDFIQYLFSNEAKKLITEYGYVPAAKNH